MGSKARSGAGAARLGVEAQAMIALREKCDRAGRCRLERLIAQHGRELKISPIG